MSILAIKLDCLPPSLNRLLRMHWAFRENVKKLLEKEIYYSSLPRLVEFTMTRRAKRRVRIIINHKRMDDPDNLSGRAKLILDVLKYMHLIWDDSSGWIDLKVEQKKTKIDEWTDIIIEKKEKKNAKQKK